jgi:protein-L-isoaspartate(D-aspartate) O-methyltransferase
VFSIDRIDAFAENAKKVLEELGYKNIMIKTGDGTVGWNEFSPFDKIIVTASWKEVPWPLIQQLQSPGKLVMPVGSRISQMLLLVEKDAEGNIAEKEICGCTFVPLIGKYGWEEYDGSKDT